MVSRVKAAPYRGGGGKLCPVKLSREVAALHAAPVRHHGAPGRGRAEAGAGLAPGLLGGTLTTNANVSLHHTIQLETLKMRVKWTKHSSSSKKMTTLDF